VTHSGREGDPPGTDGGILQFGVEAVP